MTPRHRNCLAFLLLAGVALLPTGCLWLAVGAGTAACCAGGYAYMKGEVPQTYAATFGDTWAAAQKSLGELGMPVVSAEKKNNVSGTIRSRLGNGEVVTLQVEEGPTAFPSDGPVTRVGVRVAMLGDGMVSDRILNQIGAHLPSTGGMVGAPNPGVVPAGGVTPPVNRPITPATWTGVPSVTPPPPPQPATLSTPPPPANNPPISAIPLTPRPATGLPTSTPPPPLAGPEH